MTGQAVTETRDRLDTTYAPLIRLRPRVDEDNAFIEAVTRRELVPTLEQAWGFKWDAGHARKFMLDLLTVGDTLIAVQPRDNTSAKRVGYVWYIMQPRRHRWSVHTVFWINYLIVDGEFQGQGIGKHMMSRCESIASEAGCTSMELWVQRLNTDARHFYESLHFTAGRAVDGNVPMRKRLK